MKKLLLGLLVLVLMAAAVPLGILLQAHWQVRQLDTALPTVDQIQAAITANAGPVSISYLNTASQSGPAGTIDHPGVLLRWQDGKVLLIDTGMPPAQAIAFGEPMESLLDAEPTQTYGEIAEQLGTAVDSIQGIVFTHLHSDHTDGLAGICAQQSTPATVFQTPTQRQQINYTTQPGENALSGAVCPRATLDVAPLMTIAGYPGVLALAGGGHTPGSTLYLARVGQQVWVMAGDISNDKNSMTHNQPKPWVYSTFIVPESEARLQTLRQWLAQLDARDDFEVVIQHDVAAMQASGMAAYSD